MALEPEAWLPDAIANFPGLSEDRLPQYGFEGREALDAIKEPLPYFDCLVQFAGARIAAVFAHDKKCCRDAASR